MQIVSFQIRNFRAIQAASAEGLGDFVVLAGTNGCGKSTILDALRLLKAQYGEYTPNELQTLYQELKVDARKDPKGLRPLFRDPDSDVTIEATFRVSTEERNYIRSNLRQLLEQIGWQRLKKPADVPNQFYLPETARERREISQQLNAFVGEHTAAITGLLGAEEHRLSYAVTPQFKEQWVDNPLMELIFATYHASGCLGVMDYYGAHRTYDSALSSEVSLSPFSDVELMRKHALTGFSSKLQKLGSQIRSSYLRQLVAQAAGNTQEAGASIGDALRELFANFFPHKKFVGPEPRKDGDIHFEVELQNGLTHSLAELSAGEKEVLFGYVRLWSGVSSRSVIMLDEPELHLNPKLVSGLPRFYRDSLGRARHNQLWLVTHSDALLRSSMALGDASVLHVQEATYLPPEQNQIRTITVRSELDRAVVDLAGDLASYRPGEVIVLLEGENSEFDKWVVEQLFPTFASRVNLISVGDKKVSKRLHELLEAVDQLRGGIGRVFSIRDRDFDGPLAKTHTRAFQWEAYHIENYLLESKVIFDLICQRSRRPETIQSEQDVRTQLLESARKVIPDLIRSQMETQTYRKLTSNLRTNADRASPNVADKVHEACQANLTRLSNLLTHELSLESLRRLSNNMKKEFEQSLVDNGWLSLLPGRTVLKDFISSHLADETYEPFRDRIVARMSATGVIPDGMKNVLKKIEDDLAGTEGKNHPAT